MNALLKKLARDERAASAIEYGMICSLIVLAMLAALKGVANQNSATWNTIATKSQDAVNQANAG